MTPGTSEVTPDRRTRDHQPVTGGNPGCPAWWEDAFAMISAIVDLPPTGTQDKS